MNLRLTSVMCVPLLERGNLIGLIYVGNDNVAQLFDQAALEILTIFAAQASLVIRNALLVNELQIDNQSLQDRIERIRFGEILAHRLPCRRCFARFSGWPPPTSRCWSRAKPELEKSSSRAKSTTVRRGPRDPSSA